ncbi:MAG: DNA polymerase III subunit delta [Oscillospiraceae bacterium]|nr:DNA polymerase III subunit delta [Oscillospiraceae bacterium]
MARIDEPRLKAELKAGKPSRVYFLFGEEKYLVKMYADKIISLTVGGGTDEMNFMKFTGNPRSDELSDYVDSLPFFSEYKCVLINDLEPDSMDNAELNAYIKIIGDIPETTVLVISERNVDIDSKKPKAKAKKLMAAAEKAGVVCELCYMSAAQVAAMAEKRASRAGCALSRENSTYLAEVCGRSLTAVSGEVDKLCAYKAGGEITREDIVKLTPKPVESSVYTLAGEIFAGRRDNAFRILDDLFTQQIEPIIILASLSSHFTDLYRAKLGQTAKKSYNDAAAAFRYPPNRAFLMKKAYGSVTRLSEEYLGECLVILYKTNRLLNSSKADKRTLIEEALTEISALPK